MIKPKTNPNPISDGAETLTELVERQKIPIIEKEQDMGIVKYYRTLEAA